MMIEEWGNKSPDNNEALMTPEVFAQLIEKTLNRLDNHTIGMDEESRAAQAAACIRQLLAQLPEGMKHCTIQFVECEKGHGRLTATNWVDHGCQKCELDRIIQERNDARAVALAAIQLMPEDANFANFLQLVKEAREVFLGRDKQTIAKLQDELAHAHEHARQLQRLPRPGVNTVYVVSDKNVIMPLMLLRIEHASNGGLEIEVRLP